MTREETRQAAITNLYYIWNRKSHGITTEGEMQMEVLDLIDELLGYRPTAKFLDLPPLPPKDNYWG